MRRCGLSEREQELGWELRSGGRSLRAVAREIGVGQKNVQRYVASTGGIRPAPTRRSARCLSELEREEISRGLARGEGFRAIAAPLGRSHTTVAREVNRKGGREEYRARCADGAAWERARRPKDSKLAGDALIP